MSDNKRGKRLNPQEKAATVQEILGAEMLLLTELSDSSITSPSGPGLHP